VTLLAGALSGLLFALAFPPFGVALLLPIAFVPWLVALSREESRTRALLSGAVFGLVYWCLSIRWITYVVTQYGGQSGVMGVVCLVILAAILAEWPALAAWGMVAAAPPGSAARLAAFPILWAATEHARTFVYKGFPWNLTGHALFREPLWLQSASVWGVFGVGFAVAAVSALLARSIAVRRPAPAAAAAAVVAALGLFGALRLPKPVPAEGEISVALIQPNLTEQMRSTVEGRVASYEALIAQLRDAAGAHPDLILVPESSLPATWQGSARIRQDLSGVARGGSSILFNDLDEESDGRYYNAARLLTPEGLAEATYRKVHLVPFGEYVPLPRLFFFVRRVSTAIGEFTPAAEPVLVRSTLGLALGIGVCYEIVYPGLVRREVADGANLLATLTNDSWYGRAGAQEQHFAGAALRAVENERYLVRAAITGISGVVDPRGRILAESQPDERVTVAASVRPVSGRTIWTRWGYWIPRATTLAGAGVLLFGLARLVRERARPARRSP
jgi:apolipoprotein N-acyltransferase